MLVYPSGGRALFEAAAENILERFEVFDEEESLVNVLNRLPGRVALTGVGASGRCRAPQASEGHWPRALDDHQGAVARLSTSRGGTHRGRILISCYDITKQMGDEPTERFLSDSSKVLAASLDFETMLDNLAHVAVLLFATGVPSISWTSARSIARAAIAHADPSKIEKTKRCAGRIRRDPGTEQGAESVIRSGEPAHYPDISDELVAGAAYLGSTGDAA